MTVSEMSIYENLSEFVFEPGPEDCLVKCRITRNNKGIDRGKNFYASEIYIFPFRNTKTALEQILFFCSCRKDQKLLYR